MRSLTCVSSNAHTSCDQYARLTPQSMQTESRTQPDTKSSCSPKHTHKGQGTWLLTALAHQTTDPRARDRHTAENEAQRRPALEAQAAAKRARLLPEARRLRHQNHNCWHIFTPHDRATIGRTCKPRDEHRNRRGHRTLHRRKTNDGRGAQNTLPRATVSLKVPHCTSNSHRESAF